MGLNWTLQVVQLTQINVFVDRYLESESGEQCKQTHRPVCLVAVLFYPVIPVLAYVNLLWAKPKRRGEASSAKFREAEYFACIAHAISGGIGTPVQLVFQVRPTTYLLYSYYSVISTHSLRYKRQAIRHIL